MSRAIEIIDTSGFYWAVSIDGNVIHLGKHRCTRGTNKIK